MATKKTKNPKRGIIALFFQVKAMHKAFIDPEKCGHCVECKAAKACHLKAIIRIDFSEPSVVETTYCRGCGDCMAKCNLAAIVLKTA
jgi:MinD superfamily P-loop ATPase